MRIILFPCLIVALLSAPLSIAAPGEGEPADQAAVQAAVDRYAERYPAGSIDSNATAEKALADAKAVRGQLEARYAAEERQCHSKFFVNACIDQAAEFRRRAIETIRPVELEASAYQRKARAADRDRALQERLAREAKRRSEQENSARSKAGGPAPSAQRDTAQSAEPDRIVATPSRQQMREAKQRKRSDNEAIDAEQRAKNIARFEKKQREAAERQQRIAKKLAEKRQNEEANTQGTNQTGAK
jgi:hypothetical protein